MIGIRDDGRETYLDEPLAAVGDGLALPGGGREVALAAVVLDELEDLLDAEALHMGELLVVDILAGDHLLLALPDELEPLAGAELLAGDEVVHLVTVEVVALAEGVDDAGDDLLRDGFDHLLDGDRVRTLIRISAGLTRL